MRSKNKDKKLVDWDLNIYKDPSGETDNWFIAPYVWDSGASYEYGESFMLTKPEWFAISHKDEYFEEGDDIDMWYGMEGFLFLYWDKLSDRVKFFLESLPKYTCDLYESMVR